MAGSDSGCFMTSVASSLSDLRVISGNVGNVVGMEMSLLLTPECSPGNAS